MAVGIATTLANGIFGLFKGKSKRKADLAVLQLQTELKLKEMGVSAAEAQIRVNAIEAAHKSVFVSGWRPAIGWSCGVGFLVSLGVAIYPVVMVAFEIEHTTEDLKAIAQAADDSERLVLPLLFGMLGLSGMRSYDKRKGHANK